jgi:hypothetical protein
VNNANTTIEPPTIDIKPGFSPITHHRIKGARQTSRRFIIETSGAGKYLGPIVNKEIAKGNIKTPPNVNNIHWFPERGEKSAKGYARAAEIKKDKPIAGIILIRLAPLTAT